MKRLNPWLIVLFVLALFLMFSQAPLSGRSSVNYTQFKTLLEGGQVERVIVRESNANVTLKQPTSVEVNIAGGPQKIGRAHV